MASLALPRRLVVGGGVVRQTGALLRELGARKPLVVSDAFLDKLGTVRKVTAALGDMPYGVFTDTVPDPTSDSVERLRAELVRGGYDSLVAVGGGSPMDAAKAAGVLAVHGGRMRDYKAPFQMDKPALPLLCVPCTAGTGSEATKFTIITDSETEEKMLCIGLAYLPTAAVVDYELTLSMPWRLSADTGIDALCHAMEAYVSARRNPFSQTLALGSASKIARNIRRVCQEPGDRAAREAMMLASTEAGIAFSNASVTLIHGMSRPIGALFHVPHGLSNAMLAPMVTGFSVPGSVKLYADVGRAMGLVPGWGVSDEDAAEALPHGLAALNKELKVPSMKEWGIDERRYMDSIPKMAQAALASGSPNNNPVVPTPQQVEDLYVRIWNQA
jgi:alcohol dehydrogenase class IV